MLSARIIDRSVRNLFPKNFRNEIQVIVHPLGVDYSVDLRVVSLFATSLVLNASPLPFNIPLAGVNIGYIDGKFICNPNSTEAEISELEMFLVGNENEIGMIEVGANQLTEKQIMEAIKFGHQQIRKLIEIQQNVLETTKLPDGEYELNTPDEKLKILINANYQTQITEIVSHTENRDRKLKAEQLNKLIINDLNDKEEEYKSADISDALNQIFLKAVRKHTLTQKKRIDGREFDEIRSINCEIDYLPMVHGSAIFNRGETQTLSIVTLGPTSDKQIIDNITKQDYRSFMHHYKSLPFSVGEVA